MSIKAKIAAELAERAKNGELSYTNREAVRKLQNQPDNKLNPGYGLQIDNPKGQWLEDKQAYAREKMGDGKGLSSKGISGSVTGSFKNADGYTNYLKLSPEYLKDIPGAYGEEAYRSSGERFEALRDSIKKKGYDQNEPVFINVNQFGEPYVNEGNHRIAAAFAEGVDNIPVELSYFNGGEDAGGMLSPRKLATIMQKDKIAAELAERVKGGDGLAMDFASRMQRAKEQGFDTDNVLYRGSTEKEVEAIPSEGWEHYTSGVSTTPDPEYAAFHGDNVQALYGPKGEYIDYFDLSEQMDAKFGEDWTELDATNYAKSQGYIGSKLHDPQGGVDHRIFDPKNIRSVNAAFDPAKKDSSNLLASLGAGTAAGAGLLASDDSEAGVGKLAMDTASRLKRAKEQGFDTDTVYYHGTNERGMTRDAGDGVIDGFGGTTFLAENPQLAKTYSGAEQGSIYPVYIRDGDQLLVDAKGKDWGSLDGGYLSTDDIAADAFYDGRDSVRFNNVNDVGGDVIAYVDQSGMTKHSQFRLAEQKLRDELSSETVLAIKDPKNIRSVNAAFDPAKKDSSNLLASLGAGTAAGAGLLASDDSEASFIGAAAKTWNKGAEALAKKMTDEGASRDEVWQATGQMGSPTFKDVDGMWKQEISDQDASFKDAYTKTLGNGITIGESKASSLGAGVNSDILSAYPEMQSYPLGAVWSDNPQAANNWGGSFGKRRKDISASGMTEKDALSTVMHESQHGIQELEGFASGGSLSDGFGKELRRKRIAANEVIEETGEQMKRNIQIRDRLEAEGASKERLKPYEDEYKQLISQRMKVIPDAQISNIDIAEADNRGYRRLAGEAEARNVQTRLDYDMDKRVSNPPWSTLDVPENELIVRGQKGQATVPGMIGGTGLGLAGLLAMEGEPLNTDLIQGASTKGILGALSPIADAIEFADENISGPASMMIPTGTSEYIRKLQYGDDIGYLDRLFANPLL